MLSNFGFRRRTHAMEWTVLTFFLVSIGLFVQGFRTDDLLSVLSAFIIVTAAAGIFFASGREKLEFAWLVSLLLSILFGVLAAYSILFEIAWPHALMAVGLSVMAGQVLRGELRLNGQKDQNPTINWEEIRRRRLAHLLLTLPLSLPSFLVANLGGVILALVLSLWFPENKYLIPMASIMGAAFISQMSLIELLHKSPLKKLHQVLIWINGALWGLGALLLFLLTVIHLLQK